MDPEWIAAYSNEEPPMLTVFEKKDGKALVDHDELDRIFWTIGEWQTQSTTEMQEVAMKFRDFLEAGQEAAGKNRKLKSKLADTQKQLETIATDHKQELTIARDASLKEVGEANLAKDQLTKTLNEELENARIENRMLNCQLKNANTDETDKKIASLNGTITKMQQEHEEALSSSESSYHQAKQETEKVQKLLDWS